MAATEDNVCRDLLTVGRIALDGDSETLCIDGDEVPLRPQSFKVLFMLVGACDRLVSRERLLNEVWKDKVVTDDSLVQCLVDIRRALSVIDTDIVITKPGRGYLFRSEKVAIPDQPVPARRWGMLVLGASAAALIALAFMLNIGDRESVSQPAADYDRPSIAVLPFTDMTAQQDKRYLAEGLAEEILNQLTATDGLRVISRTSSFAFQQGMDVAAIAEKLSVTHILEGSVREGDDRLRITVQLVDAADSAQLWSRSFDRSMEDILDVQLEIAGSVAAALNTTLNDDVWRDLDENPFVHALVIQAKALLQLRTANSSVHAQQLLNDALQIDPDNPTALSVLARAVRQGGPPRGVDGYHEAWLSSIELTEHALAQDPDHPYAVAQQGWTELYYWKDYPAAARSIERAMSLDPTHPEVIRLTTNALLVLNQPDRSVALGQYAIDQDPLCISCQGFLAMTAGSAGDLELAESTVRRMLELQPTNTFAQEFLGDIYLSRGNPAAALDQFARCPDEDTAGMLLARAIAHYQLEEIDKYEALRERLIALHGEVRPSYVARLEAHAGNIDEAFAWLDKQLAKPSWDRSVNHRSSWFANLHDDPRWGAYLTALGVAPAQLASIGFDPPLPYGTE